MSPKPAACFLFFILMSLRAAAATDEILASPFTEEQRLKGFYLHQKNREDFERQRLLGVAEVKSARQAWSQRLAATLPEFKKEKAQRAAPLDEFSPQYKEDLKNKQLEAAQLERLRKAYVQARDQARLQKKATVKLTEDVEYGLVPPPERVEWSKRNLYAGKSKASRGGSLSTDYTPPPPPPPAPPPADFYEPNIPPPPPPPPMDSFEEALPPPIFDEPEF